MAKSKAQKKRNHDIRNGKKNVNESRGGICIQMSTHVRKGKTKVTQLVNENRKNLNLAKREYQFT